MLTCWSGSRWAAGACLLVMGIVGLVGCKKDPDPQTDQPGEPPADAVYEIALMIDLDVKKSDWEVLRERVTMVTGNRLLEPAPPEFTSRSTGLAITVPVKPNECAGEAGKALAAVLERAVARQGIRAFHLTAPTFPEAATAAMKARGWELEPYLLDTPAMVVNKQPWAVVRDGVKALEIPGVILRAQKGERPTSGHTVWALREKPLGIADHIQSAEVDFDGHAGTASVTTVLDETGLGRMREATSAGGETWFVRLVDDEVHSFNRMVGTVTSARSSTPMGFGDRVALLDKAADLANVLMSSPLSSRPTAVLTEVRCGQ